MHVDLGFSTLRDCETLFRGGACGLLHAGTRDPWTHVASFVMVNLPSASSRTPITILRNHGRSIGTPPASLNYRCLPRTSYPLTTQPFHSVVDP